jgi:hypothetical protein
VRRTGNSRSKIRSFSCCDQAVNGYTADRAYPVDDVPELRPGMSVGQSRGLQPAGFHGAFGNAGTMTARATSATSWRSTESCSDIGRYASCS